ncbi:MAG: EutN/CcmL family microcompartment protein [Candidatus Eremiobacterota bacterium]
MILGRVAGSLWATEQDPGFDRLPLKLVVPVDARDRGEGGQTVLAVDLVGSRQHDLVLVVYEGSSSRLALGTQETACEAIIVGIVDQLEVSEAT